MKLLILSDIHGNISALQKVLQDAECRANINALVLLGDLIDYGMNSNEVIEYLLRVNYPILCNIMGNHEISVINECYDRFATERGVVSAKHTRESLSEKSWDYLKKNMVYEGKISFNVAEKSFLAVHGSLEDTYWKAISADVSLTGYEKYDYVLSGHSHIPHFFEKFTYKNDPKMRNQKKVIFINPGAVGQPRNHNNRAQYVILDTDSEEIIMCKTDYDIEKEQNTFNGQVDDFYRERLGLGV